jgi:hypothetical protein
LAKGYLEDDWKAMTKQKEETSAKLKADLI